MEKQILPFAVALVLLVSHLRVRKLSNHNPRRPSGGYWRLEEANGLTAVSDSTTNANTGFVTYATQGDGSRFPEIGGSGDIYKRRFIR